MLGLLLQVVCPSALESFAEITDLAREKIVALFLDYDGTLAPIVNNPAAAFMSEEVKSRNHFSTH